MKRHPLNLFLIALIIASCAQSTPVYENGDETETDTDASSIPSTSIYTGTETNGDTSPAQESDTESNSGLDSETGDVETEGATCENMPADIEFIIPSLQVCNSLYSYSGSETLTISQENENTFILESSYREARCEKSDCHFLCRELTLSEIDVDGEDEEGNSIGASITYTLEMSGTYSTNHVVSISAVLRKTCSGELCSGEDDCSADVSDLITW